MAMGAEDETPVPGRAVVTAALLLAMTAAALEQTVVSTAMPSIIAQLNGLETYPWVMSAYLLALTVSTPLYGKLADVLGRKRVLLFGLGLFSLGSVLSGLAGSMAGLIAFRGLQGLGAGAVMPIVLTMLGDFYALRERAQVQGWFSGVWGVSSIAGPTIGGLLTDHLSWRWVFFVTVPFSMFSAWVLLRHVRERVDPGPVPPIDWAGAALMAVSTAALMLAVLGGSGMPAAASWALLAVAGVGAIAFIAWERRASDPVLPPDLLARREIGWAVAGSFAMGGLLFGLDVFVPLFVQGVRGGSAMDGGRAIMPLFLAWALSVAVAARVVVRFGFRATAVAGSLMIVSGMFALALVVRHPGASGPWLPASMVVVGLGMGPTMLSYTLGVQSAVSWGRRGVATGSLTFFRTLGGALGVGLLGKLVGLGLARRLAEAGVQGIDVTSALRPETHRQLSGEQLRAVRSALGGPLAEVFTMMVGLALAALVCGALLRGGRPSPQGQGLEAPSARDDLELIAASEA